LTLFRQRKQHYYAKKREYREGVEQRCEERQAKKAEKLAEKQAKVAEIASLL
jgi:hypothetical protein